MPSSLRFAGVVLMLVGTTIFLQARAKYEQLPPREPLASLPHGLGAWRGEDQTIGKDVLDVLGNGDFLSRAYKKAYGDRPVQLFIAYFPTQRSGDTIHSPQNCLPGSGWSPLDSSRTLLTLPGHQPFWVNRYLVGKGGRRELVLYWYWSHGRAEASEYWAKFYLVADSIRMHRSDGALIRVSTQLGSGDRVDQAQQRLIAFSGELVPIINVYVPR